MEFFIYHRDRPGSEPLREELVEQHWSYMDRFADELIARGPTFDGETLAGSVLIEPLRIAVISGAYDATLGRLRRRQQARPDASASTEAEAEMRAVADAAGLLPSSVDAVAAAVVSAPPRDAVGGQGSNSNLTNEPPAR